MCTHAYASAEESRGRETPDAKHEVRQKQMRKRERGRCQLASTATAHGSASMHTLVRRGCGLVAARGLGAAPCACKPHASLHNTYRTHSIYNAVRQCSPT
jgi:hypothetical protein